MRIRVDACGINWGDIQKRRGDYPDPVSYPLTPGMEVAGVIDCLGDGVNSSLLGDRVAALCGPSLAGGYAEYVVVPATFVVPLPVGFYHLAAAGHLMAGLTAYHLLNTATQIQPGGSILIHSAAGGVGLALIQCARIRGLQVFGTVGRGTKIKLCQDYGADLVVDRSSDDFVDVVNHYTHGAGVDLVIDSVGGDVLRKSFEVLRPFGTVVNIGEASGGGLPNLREVVYERSTSFAGFELLHAIPGSATWAEGLVFLLQHLQAGFLRLPISFVEGLDALPEAHRRMEAGLSTGKTVVRLSHPSP